MKDRDDFLEKEFNFSKAEKNPHAKALKKPIEQIFEDYDGDYKSKE